MRKTNFDRRVLHPPFKLAVCAGLGALALALPVAAAADPSSATTESAREQALGHPISGNPACAPPAVMCGLDNPRGLAFDAQGALYVAEAGRGGDGTCILVENPPAPPQEFCYGPTGAVSRLWRGVQERVAQGLPSIARKTDGTRAEGPNGIAMRGVREAFVTIGLERDRATRDRIPAFAGFGHLVHLRANGHWRSVADIAAFSAPDPSDESNPFGILAHRGGHLLTDASANTLLRVSAKGDISVVAVFPSRDTGRSTDAVPTSVTTGPGGDIYVSELTGFPLIDGAANIYRVKRGHDPDELCSLESVHPAHEEGRHGTASPSCGVFLSGFRAIIDIAFDRKGDLYVLQHATATPGAPGGAMGPGLVWRVKAPDYTTPEKVREGLNRPTSIAFGRDGALYVTNRGVMAGTGEVLRFEPPFVEP